MYGRIEMPLTNEEKIIILGKETEEIYQNYLLGNNAYCFSPSPTFESINKYDDFKSDVANLMGVHKNNVGIFGSGKIGFSLNPINGLKDFTEQSDIDIAIVSSEHYAIFRKEYIEEFYNGRFKFYKHKKVASAIFRKFIIFDGFSEKNELYRKWIEDTGEFESTIQMKYELVNDINYRIFESWDAVSYYYKKSIKECKEKYVCE
jgi:hypothetical protein